MIRSSGAARILAAAAFLGTGLPAFAGVSTTNHAAIAVDPAVAVNTFRPADMFGLNLVPYVDKADLKSVRPMLQKLGMVFLRYPSGIADDVHWNGAGSFDAQGWWVPDANRYEPSFQGLETHRGTTSHYGRPSMVTDGDTNTYWLSDADAASPSAQWLYVDLGSIRAANAVSIVWGNPHATQFTVQYWSPLSANQWAPYSHTTDDWRDTTARQIAGVGGAQQVEFKAVHSRYIRLFLTASSVTPAQYAVAELRVLDGTRQITTNLPAVSHAPGSVQWTPQQSCTVASTTDPACSRELVYGFDFESFIQYAHALSTNVSPLITVNCGGGTPQEAAAWVHYANRVKHYGIKYWEIGNEMNGSWETGGPLGAREYARRYIAFCRAMKSADPSIVIGGPGTSDAAVPSNEYDGNSYVESFVDTLASEGKAGWLELVDLHWYPFFMNDDPEQTWRTVSQISDLPSNLDRWLARHPRRSNVPLVISEFNSGAGTPFSTRMENALWLANTFGEFIRGFGSRGSASYWTALHPADAATSPGGGDQSLMQLEKNPWQYQERAVYWATFMLSTCWAIPGDTTPHTLVQASSDQPSLVVYADRRPDKVLSLLVINRDPEKASDASIELRHFAAAGEAGCWTFDASNYAWSTNSLPFHASPSRPPDFSRQTVSDGSRIRHLFPPSSLTVFQFR